ncbi:hypothetical protein ZOSMA_137G00530 [Zostera marina]|uniref:Uncharacterized protein n=1 Tax=Zostera marina TaxID=29655 RepID=A0A0K9Q0Q6_ZOSMR|nr:hypothetical protein ZOSMA_137G00530 [Zostera marina]
MFVFPNTNEEILWSCQECAPIFPTSANIFQKGHNSSTDPSSDLENKKDQNHKKNLLHRHPKFNSMFRMLLDDTTQVGDEICDLLHKRLSLTASDNKLLPMDIPWENQTGLEDVIQSLMREFNLSQTDEVHRFINKSLNQLWRISYNRLIRKYDFPGLSINEVIKILPDQVMKDQFCNKLRERRLDKMKVISEIDENSQEEQTPYDLSSKGFSKHDREEDMINMSHLETVSRRNTPDMVDLNRQNKGKSIQTDEDRRRDEDIAALWERIHKMERAMLAVGIDISAANSSIRPLYLNTTSTETVPESIPVMPFAEHSFESSSTSSPIPNVPNYQCLFKKKKLSSYLQPSSSWRPN